MVKQYLGSLHKYRSVDSIHTESIITQQELFFSKSDRFNDPFEIKPIFKMPSYSEMNEMSNRILGPLYNEEQLKRTYQNLLSMPKEQALGPITETISQLIRKHRYCCFCMENDNILLYSYYANNHNGICFSFNPKLDKKLLGAAFEVDYTDSTRRIEFDIYKVINGSLDSFYLNFTKSIIWKHENEVRVMKLSPQEKYNFKKEALEEVIFGCNVDQKDKDKYIRLLNDNGFDHVKIGHARISNSLYKLTIEYSD